MLVHELFTANEVSFRIMALESRIESRKRENPESNKVEAAERLLAHARQEWRGMNFRLAKEDVEAAFEILNME